jgi:hypothetical protein
MPSTSEITILPFRQLEGLVGQSEGLGIFIDCGGGNRMNVGAILPRPDGKFLLNVMILAEMQVPRYKPCDLMDLYDTIESATQAAMAFLESQREDGRTPNAL